MAVNPPINIDLSVNYQPKPQPEQQHVHQAATDAAPDNDDQSIQSMLSQQSTVNISGPSIGTIIDTTA